jgi:hypothetical protein
MYSEQSWLKKLLFEAMQFWLSCLVQKIRTSVEVFNYVQVFKIGRQSPCSKWSFSHNEILYPNHYLHKPGNTSRNFCTKVKIPTHV